MVEWGYEFIIIYICIYLKILKNNFLIGIKKYSSPRLPLPYPLPPPLTSSPPMTQGILSRPQIYFKSTEKFSLYTGDGFPVEKD